MPLLGVVDPWARHELACEAFRELAGIDGDGLVDALHATALRPGVNYLTGSGGQRFLEIGTSGGIAARGVNTLLQKWIGNTPNDGLVADYKTTLLHLSACRSSYRHCNAYPEFRETNHTYLIQRQQVISIVGSWLTSRVFCSNPIA